VVENFLAVNAAVDINIPGFLDRAYAPTAESGENALVGERAANPLVFKVPARKVQLPDYFEKSRICAEPVKAGPCARPHDKERILFLDRALRESECRLHVSRCGAR
jgi:hypothetical protein